MFKCYEVYNMYPSPNILQLTKSRRIKWAGYVERMGEMRNLYRILVGKPQEKRSLTRPRRRRGDNMRKDLREIKWEGVDWIHLAQDRYQ
jgi:hypothetical protein